GGAIVGPSSYFMKSPPQQFPDHVAREMTLQFIADGHSDRSATNLDHAVRARTSRDVRANGCSFVRPPRRRPARRARREASGPPRGSICARCDRAFDLREPAPPHVRDRCGNRDPHRRGRTRLRGAGRDRLRPMGGAKLHRAERRCRVALVERGAVSCEHTCRRDDRERSAKNRWAVVRDRCDAAAERGHHRDTQRDHPQSSLVWLERFAGPLRPAHDRSRLYHDGRARRSALSGDCSQRAVGLMKIVVFGLTISSSWGNGHATLWRGLTKGLARLGHVVVFFARDVPYYAYHRDWHTCPNAELVLLQSFRGVREKVRAELEHADAAIVTSYCPDAALATAEIFDANRPLAVFYDLDTPITLSRVRAGETIPYLPPNGLRDFDLVLSYTGGSA